MARIVGVDLPKNKRGEVGLTYIYGIGRSSAQKILDDGGFASVVITLDKQGAYLARKGQEPAMIPTRPREVYDVTGAGDTVISVLAAGLAARASLYDSIELANAAAGIVVREIGTAAVTIEELAGAFPA